jgi:hypothetical protein
MRKALIFPIIFIVFLLLGCSKTEQGWFQSNVGRYQVTHYTTHTIPFTDYYIRVDTVTGKTELFTRAQDRIIYLSSFYSPEVEGKKLIEK